MQPLRGPTKEMKSKKKGTPKIDRARNPFINVEAGNFFVVFVPLMDKMSERCSTHVLLRAPAHGWGAQFLSPPINAAAALLL
jgi:hypothetical protein